MTFLTKSAGLAAILAASVSGAALAQSASLGADAGASVSADGSGSSAGIGADADVTADGGSLGGTSSLSGEAATDMAASGASQGAADELNYGRVVSSLQTGQNAEADIAGITADSTVETTTLSELQGESGDTAAALDTALEQAELSSMHDMISANAEFNAMLEAEGYTADDVIGVYSKADGGVQVLIDDRS